MIDVPRGPAIAVRSPQNRARDSYAMPPEAEEVIVAARDSGPGVRQLCPQDTRSTARLHTQALPDGFFARLGPGFLSLYHRTFVDSPHAVALAAGPGGDVDAFLLAVIDPAAHGAYVLRRFGPRLALRGLVALLVRPGLLVLFMRTRLARYARGLWRRRLPPAPPQSQAQGGTWAVLSHIAVEAGSRKAGHGAALVRELEALVRSSGTSGVVLLTAQHGPGAAFYARLGYTNEGAAPGTDGQQWLRFRRSFLQCPED